MALTALGLSGDPVHDPVHAAAGVVITEGNQALQPSRAAAACTVHAASFVLVEVRSSSGEARVLLDAGQPRVSGRVTSCRGPGRWAFSHIKKRGSQ